MRKATFLFLNPNFLPYVCVHVSVSVSVSMCLYMCMHVHVETRVGIAVFHNHSLFLSQNHSLILELADWLNCLGPKLRSSRLCG